MNQTSLSLPSRAIGRTRIAIVASSWHGDIVDQGTPAIRAELQRACDPPAAIET